MRGGLGVLGGGAPMSRRLENRVAIVEELGIQKENEFFREISLGKSKFKRYSQLAFEKLQKELKSISEQVEAEKKTYEHTKQQLGGKLSQLQNEVDQLRPLRDEAAAGVAAKARDSFERLADRFEGEALSALGKPDRRREEYICNACNMSLVADIYNRLHSRDELVLCPNCRRLLYIPDELPPELAINTKPPRKAFATATDADE